MPRVSPSTVHVRPLHVSILALPESMISPLIGVFEVLAGIQEFAAYDAAFPRETRFHPEIVVPARDLPSLSGRLPPRGQRTIAEIPHTDIIIVPSMMVSDDTWVCGRYPEMVAWVARMHAAGAELCSSCSGVLLLAETELWNDQEATIHWAYATTFRKNFPRVGLRLREVLVVAGSRGELITSGASTSWHDLVLFLVSRHLSPTTAQALARFLLMQWHIDGQAPYLAFAPPKDHGDALIGELQDWLEDNYSSTGILDALVKRSGLPERTLKRRFTHATGHSPIAYVQRLRVEEAKRRLERTDTAIDEISWTVGYEDPGFFRRLFKRVTDITPGQYRRKFRVPDFAR